MLAATLALVVATAASPRLELEGRAGGGYDSNLSHDPSSAAAVGSAFLSASAAAGASLAPGRVWDLYAGGRLSGTEVVDVSDLSSGRAEAELSVAGDPFARVGFSAGAWGGRAWWRDAARDAWVFGASAGARLRVSARVALGARYERARDDARDPIYSTTRDRVIVRVTLRAARAVRLRASYGWTWGDEVLYEPITTGGTAVAAQQTPRDGRSGGGGGTRRDPSGRPVTTSFPGAEREVVLSPALTGTAGAGIELALTEHVYVDLGGAYARVDSEAGDYDALSATALLGWRR